MVVAFLAHVSCWSSGGQLQIAECSSCWREGTSIPE
jgi:hypothetical protein